MGGRSPTPPPSMSEKNKGPDPPHNCAARHPSPGYCEQLAMTTNQKNRTHQIIVVAVGTIVAQSSLTTPFTFTKLS